MFLNQIELCKKIHKLWGKHCINPDPSPFPLARLAAKLISQVKKIHDLLSRNEMISVSGRRRLSGPFSM